MSEKLRDCPFCGGVDIRRDFDRRNKLELVFCDDCSAEIKGQTLGEAIAAWNRRAPSRPSQDGPSIPAPNQHKPKPPGYVTLAELDEMSMKPAKEPGQ